MGIGNDSLVVMAKPLLMRSCLFCSLPNSFYLADGIVSCFGLFEECSGQESVGQMDGIVSFLSPVVTRFSGS